MSFLVQTGVNAPRKTVSYRESISTDKNRIAKDLHKIRHWDIRCGDYRDAQNEECTWFIDPPYLFGGEYYRLGNKNIDYSELAEWCKSRLGQVIVCENTKANWLPFTPLKSMHGSKHTTTEAIWCSDFQQLRIF